MPRGVSQVWPHYGGLSLSLETSGMGKRQHISISGTSLISYSHADGHVLKFGSENTFLLFKESYRQVSIVLNGQHNQYRNCLSFSCVKSIPSAMRTKSHAQMKDSLLP